jgi:hypothetical protein
MPACEVNSSNWKARIVGVNGGKVASVSFNKAANTTEITMKPGATYEAILDGVVFEVDSPAVIPVKGVETEVKKKLGL